MFYPFCVRFYHCIAYTCLFPLTLRLIKKGNANNKFETGYLFLKFCHVCQSLSHPLSTVPQEAIANEVNKKQSEIQNAITISIQ